MGGNTDKVRNSFNHGMAWYRGMHGTEACKQAFSKRSGPDMGVAYFTAKMYNNSQVGIIAT